jgi:VWFA-related protein
VTTNFVEVPFTVKDAKGNLVPGLTWRDVIVRENGAQQRLALFTEDPFPISAAIVVDQSLPQSVMEKVNTALGALQGAFTASDELAIITYNNGPRAENGGKFSAAPSANITALLEKAKGPGRPMGVPINDGPMAGCDRINETDCFDNNATMHPGQGGTFITIPKEIHTLNDAIFMAAQAVSKRGTGRRRIVYVISDGKENGSKLGFNEVKRYLLAQKVSVYATVVGDSAVWGLGFLDRLSLPYQMKDNYLPKYVLATGGDIVSEFREANIQSSFAKISGEVRNQYTLGYYSHEPFIDGKYRSIEVLVKRPGLTVIARPGYYPTAADVKPH